MSTSYQYIREPFTSIRLEEGPGHDVVTLWENHACAGMLTVTKGKGREIVSLLAYDDDDGKCPMRTHWGGPDVGAVVTENVRGLSDDLVLISEYGEPITVREIRSRGGAHRSDGMPTELFGYEPSRPKGAPDA